MAARMNGRPCGMLSKRLDESGLDEIDDTRRRGPERLPLISRSAHRRKPTRAAHQQPRRWRPAHRVACSRQLD